MSQIKTIRLLFGLLWIAGAMLWVSNFWDRTIFPVSVSVGSLTASLDIQFGLICLVLVASAGLWATHTKAGCADPVQAYRGSEVPGRIEISGETDLKRTGPDNSQTAGNTGAQSDGEPQPVEKFLEGLYQKYKNFYGDIEGMAIDPKREESRLVKRRLVEMGLLSLSLARAWKLGKLNRPNDEPNIKIITNRYSIAELERRDYRLYSTDPYETEKRYHILRKVFQDLDLDQLDVCVENTYIDPEHLKKN